MIDLEKLQALRTEKVPEMTRQELRALENALKESSLSNMNLEHELLVQYQTVKDLQDDVLNNDDIPANQKAQVSNAVASTLGQLIKMQTELDRETRLKLMETCLIEAIQTLPVETKDAFFREYERMAAQAGLS